MFIKRINVKPMIVCPMGSILPESLPIPKIAEGTFLEKIHASLEQEICVTMLTTEELIALVEKPHLFGIDAIALIGAPGGRYDAIWSSYVAPLRRVSLDTLDAEVKKILEHTAKEHAQPRPRSIVDSLEARPSVPQRMDAPLHSNPDDDPLDE